MVRVILDMMITLFIFSAKCPNYGGVAFLVSSETSQAVLGYHAINERIITIHLNENVCNIKLVQVYGPSDHKSKFL